MVEKRLSRKERLEAISVWSEIFSTFRQIAESDNESMDGVLWDSEDLDEFGSVGEGRIVVHSDMQLEDKKPRLIVVNVYDDNGYHIQQCNVLASWKDNKPTVFPPANNPARDIGELSFSYLELGGITRELIDAINQSDNSISEKPPEMHQIFRGNYVGDVKH